MYARLSNDLSLHLMKLGIQYIMLDPAPLKHPAQKLGILNGNSTHQHRLMSCVGFLNSVADCPELLLLGLIHRIVQILTGNRLIGRDLDNVHPVDLPELLLFRQRRTGHTCFLRKFIKQILEGDRRKRLALSLHLHMLLRLDRLMQSV